MQGINSKKYIEGSQDNVGKLKDDFSQMHEKLESKSKLLAEAESQLAEKETQMIQLKTTVATLYNEKEVIASKLAERDRQAEQVEDRIQELKDENSKIQELLQTKEKELATLQAATQSVLAYSCQIVILVQGESSTSLKTENEELSKELVTCKDELNAKLYHLEQVTKRQGVLEKQLEENKSLIIELESKNAALLQDVESLKQSAQNSDEISRYQEERDSAM